LTVLFLTLLADEAKLLLLLFFIEIVGLFDYNFVERVFHVF